MQWLAAICVRRPVFTMVLILTLVVVGTASILGLGIDRFPKIDFPIVTVTTVLPGASPEQMETEVSDKLEEQINSISGLDELRSTSFEGLSIVLAQFDLDKDTAVAAQEVRDRVNRTLSVLPQGIDQPRVEQIDPDAAPVLMVSLTGPRSTRDMTEYATRVLRRQLESIDGVGGVTIVGGRARQINVVIDPARLQANSLTVADVQQALRVQNVEIPGGTMHVGARDYTLRVAGRIADVSQLNELTIASRNGGLTVRLRDVGQAIDGDEDPASIAAVNGRETVVLQIRKQSGTNTVAVIDRLLDRVHQLEHSLPSGFRLTVVRDESEFIRNAIHAVEEHLVLGGLFAALVVLVFLWNFRSTIIASLAIPTSIIATFVLIKAMGLTLNTLTLLALTLAVGIVIDDAIVVLENITKFIEEKGYPPRRAAVLATREIGLAVLATTLSLIAVFLPVAFMGGIIGRFMKSFGFTMSFSIAVSLLVSFTLTPMLSARWLKPTGGAHPSGAKPPPVEEEKSTALDDELPDPPPEPRGEELDRYAQWSNDIRGMSQRFAGIHGAARGLYGAVERIYLRMLSFSMTHRWVIALAMVASCGSLAVTGKIVQKNFLPLDDESRFELSIRAPEGTGLLATELTAERIARAVRTVPGVAYTVTTTGSPVGDISGRGANEASIFVALTGPTTRHRDQYQIMDDVRAILPRFRAENLRAIVTPVNAFGGGGGAQSAAIQYVIRGPDLERLDQYSQAMLRALRRVPGVVDADTTLVRGKPEYVLHINRARAADLNVNVENIANAIRLLVGNVQVSNYNEGSEQYEIHVVATDTYRTDIAALQQMTISAGPGRSVHLADVVEVREATGPTSIQRLSRQRQVTIYCNTVPGTSEANVINALQAAQAELHMDPQYAGGLAGRSKELGRAAQNFLIAFVLSFVFMYLILAAQFESWIHPFTIMISLPLTVPFAILSLVVLNQSINIFSTLGILVLFGIVKKNSILQVDHIRELRRTGMSRADAVMVGNRDRLRPILMTTIAFVAGMVPLVVSSGAGAGTNRAMGSVIMGGQTLSLLLTLLATPVVYSWFDDLSALTRRIGGRRAQPEPLDHANTNA